MQYCLWLLRIAAVAGCGAIASTLKSVPVDAQVTSNPHVQLTYLTPHNAELKFVADRVKKWEVLEQFGQFLVPLRLPRKLVIQFDECGAVTRPYRPGGPVTVCYELVDKIQQTATRVDPDLRELVLVGTIIQAIFHETAVAVFDVLQVPIWGRREDAADRLAGFLMVEFGPELAKRLIIGTAIFFKESGKTWTGSQFADASAPEAQRFYNYLCMAYGSEPKTFSSFVEDESGGFALPRGRAGLCKNEFEQVRKAFNLRIMPYVDPDLLVRIRAKPWLLFASTKL
ncbi:MAG: hypothetical protein J2P54_07560 [Bradyrhizobiaceae bacterium]|nr:hypothetical protein [Bradyrhizobiaceae bacterium]